jgi:hypothetical protein
VPRETRLLVRSTSVVVLRISDPGANFELGLVTEIWPVAWRELLATWPSFPPLLHAFCLNVCLTSLGTHRASPLLPGAREGVWGGGGTLTCLAITSVRHHTLLAGCPVSEMLSGQLLGWVFYRPVHDEVTFVHMGHVPNAFGWVGDQPNENDHTLQGYLAHKKPQPPLSPPQEPRYDPTVGSYGVVVFCKRGNPVPKVCSSPV